MNILPQESSILVLGSGPIRIGQAAEFDYSGSQACRALREEGYKVILLNSNPATIQTDLGLADCVYIRPLTAHTVRHILEKHRPAGVIATLGGQTALNLCMECSALGIWEEYGTQILGTSVEAIQRSEGRDDFRSCMLELGQPIVESRCVSSLKEALDFSASNPFPLIIRPDFTLGGTGGGVARDRASLEIRVAEGLRASPVKRVLLERYLQGWREIEAEVLRDARGNRLCICSMENIDPMGVHTGDSVVVAPVLTLTDAQWQRLRSAALEIVDALDIRGACNVQFAISPDSSEYVIIEVNPRASRSSALASKATGYPIARMAAKIALGKALTEMPNPVTGTGSALQEPALDYVALKVPLWPFGSFPGADVSLGTIMKATGEVLGLGTNFNAALLKAFRSLDGKPHLPSRDRRDSPENLWKACLTPTHRRLEAVMELLLLGVPSGEISQKTGIHPYFIEELGEITGILEKLSRGEPSEELLRKAKETGLPDATITEYTGISREDLRARYAQASPALAPGFREVDGCAGEIPSGSGYWYSSYGMEGDRISETSAPPQSLAVLGSGPIRIAQGVEFDYCCVKAVQAIQRRGYRAVMINNNPETVSTDHDCSDALYLEPLCREEVEGVFEREKVRGYFASFGGQTALSLGMDLAGEHPLLGTDLSGIHRAESRGEFSALLEKEGIPLPPGEAAHSIEQGLHIADNLGYPLMVRPSFVIGGVAMAVVYEKEELLEILKEAFSLETDQEVLLDRFLPGKEFEIDAVCEGSKVIIPGIFEHLDPAGIHSGDSIALFPALSLEPRHREEILRITSRIAGALNVRGLLNIQFVLHDGMLYVIEANPRGSRTVPIVTKLTQVPLVDLAVGVALGEPLEQMAPETGLLSYKGPFGVKIPVFSTEKLPGIDFRLGPKMQSTGEVLGVSANFAGALREALAAMGTSIPSRGKVLFSVHDRAKSACCASAALYAAAGWELFATPGTAEHLRKWGIPVRSVPKGEKLVQRITSKEWDLLVNIPGNRQTALRDGFAIRRAAVEGGLLCFHSLECANALGVSLPEVSGGHEC